MSKGRWTERDVKAAEERIGIGKQEFDISLNKELFGKGLKEPQFIELAIDERIAYEYNLMIGYRLTDEQMNMLGFCCLGIEVMGAVRTTKYISVMPMERLSEANKAAKRRWLEYCAYKDKVRAAFAPGGEVCGCDIVAEFAMPVSWSKRKRSKMVSLLHDSKPDRDNIDKGVLDACLKEDKSVGIGLVVKRWGEVGRLWVRWRYK